MKTASQIIYDHLFFQGNTDDKWYLQASIKHYLETGKPSGSFHEALTKAMEAYKSLPAPSSGDSAGQTEWFIKSALAIIGGEISIAKKHKIDVQFHVIEAWLRKHLPADIPAVASPEGSSLHMKQLIERELEVVARLKAKGFKTKTYEAMNTELENQLIEKAMDERIAELKKEFSGSTDYMSGVNDGLYTMFRD